MSFMCEAMLPTCTHCKTSSRHGSGMKTHVVYHVACGKGQWNEASKMAEIAETDQLASSSNKFC